VLMTFVIFGSSPAVRGEAAPWERAKSHEPSVLMNRNNTYVMVLTSLVNTRYCLARETAR
jgi:hypothetical protein